MLLNMVWFRRVLPIFLAATCILMAHPGARAGTPEDLKRLLPADTLLVAELGEAPGLVKMWANSPYNRFYEDPRAANFFRPLRERVETFKRRMAVEPARLWGFFSGQVILAALPSSKGLEWVVLARHNGDAAVIEKLQRPPAPTGTTLRRTPETLEGRDITRFEVIREESAPIPEPENLEKQRKDRRPTLTAADLAAAQGSSAPPVAVKRQVSQLFDLYIGPDFLVYAGSKGRPIQRILRRIANPEADTLTGEAAYKRVHQAMGPGEITIYSKAGALAATVLGSIGKLSGIVNVGALGFEGIKGAGAAIRLKPGRVETDLVVLAPEPHEGISRLLFLPEEKAPDLAAVAPPDAVAYADIAIPLDKIFGSVMQTLQTASPAIYILLEGQFRTFEQATGISVQTALADRLGNRLVRFMLPAVRTGGKVREPAITMVGLKDGAAFRDALKALMEYTLPFIGYHLEIDKAGGWPLWALGEGASGTPGAAAGRTLYYLCITDQWLIAAPRRDEIEAVTRRMEQPAGGETLRGQALYRRVTDQLSPQRFATMVMDTGGLYKVSESILGATPAAGSLEAKAKDVSRQVGEVVGLRMSAMPEAKVWNDYFGAAGAALIREGNEILRLQSFFEYLD